VTKLASGGRRGRPPLIQRVLGPAVARGGGAGRRRPGRSGFSLIETMIAAILLIVVFFGLAQVYARGRRQIDYEEDRRKASAVAQARLDGIRRDFRYDDLPGLAGTDTTYAVDGRTYTVGHAVQAGVPEAQATTVTVTVAWNAAIEGGTVARDLACTTILARGLP
jgi:type II secretory pathway pseudopilin PulG